MQFYQSNTSKAADIMANSGDPDYTAPLAAVWPGSILFAIPSVICGHITFW